MGRRVMTDIAAALDLGVQFLMWKGVHYAQETVLFLYVLHLAFLLRKAEESAGKRFFWCESIFRVTLLAFGGGTMVPIALGKQPFPVFNDFAITFLLAAWWL